MKALLTFIITLTVSIQAFSCECPEYNLHEFDSQSYEWSDVVLTGEIVQTGEEYQIKVIEVFKGKVENKALFVLTTGDEEVLICTFYPHRKGEYLLYLKKTAINGKPFYYSMECMGSRLLNSEYLPVSLATEKSKKEISQETSNWIEKLRRKK